MILRSSFQRKPNQFFHRAAAVTASLLVIGGCATSQYQPDPGLNILFPSPLSGPGRPSIDRQDVKRIDLAWRQTLGGQLAAARASCAAIEGSPHAKLLILDIDHVEEKTDLTRHFSDLAALHPTWAAAWLSLSIVAEKEGNEVRALDAATRGANLWSNKDWASRPGNLRIRWIDDRLTNAEKQLIDDQAEQALVTIERALIHEPTKATALLLKGRCLLALDRSDDAETVLAALDNNPEALNLRAQIAESNSDWMRAMNLYGLLPSDHEYRKAGLVRAQLKWRLSVLPQYVDNALASMQLTRAELAIILIALAPDAEAMEGGRVPLLPDIVELPYQREILSAVRVELINIDPVEHRFHPDQLASLDEIQDATRALAHLLGFKTPIWCANNSDAETDGCQSLHDPVSGSNLADIIMGIMQETD